MEGPLEHRATLVALTRPATERRRIVRTDEGSSTEAATGHAGRGHAVNLPTKLCCTALAEPGHPQAAFSALTMLGMILFGVGAVIAMLSIGTGARAPGHGPHRLAWALRNVLIHGTSSSIEDELERDPQAVHWACRCATCRAIRESVPHVESSCWHPGWSWTPTRCSRPRRPRPSRKVFGVSPRATIKRPTWSLSAGSLSSTRRTSSRVPCAGVRSSAPRCGQSRPLRLRTCPLGRPPQGQRHVARRWWVCWRPASPTPDRSNCSASPVESSAAHEMLRAGHHRTFASSSTIPLAGASWTRSCVTHAAEGARPGGRRRAIMSSGCWSRLARRRVEDTDPHRARRRSWSRASSTQRLFNIVMGCIAGISLVVGGIGIMNIMLATVLERTRESGIRRAVGRGAATFATSS